MPSRHRVSASPAANAPLPSPSFSFPPPISLYDLSLSLVEAVFSLGEFIVAMAVIKETLMKLYHALHHTDTIPPYNLFAMHVAINASVMALVAWRLASRLGVPVHALVDKLGLGLTELLSSKAWGKLTVAVIVLHTLGFAGMVSCAPAAATAGKRVDSADGGSRTRALCGSSGAVALLVRRAAVLPHQLLQGVRGLRSQHVSAASDRTP